MLQLKRIHNTYKINKGGNELLNVLSLFDGGSCGQVALQRANIKVEKYYASEINPNSVKVTQKNYPNTIQLGDVTQLNKEKLLNLGKIDLLIGGSPCEDLTITAIDRKDINKGLEGKKSKLFYNYVDALNIIKPKYFLLENVASMTKENIDIISSELGVKPILINSNLVSAQDRERLYWTNITGIAQPKNKEILLKHVLQRDVEEKFYYNKPFEFYGLDKKVCAKLLVNSHDLVKRVYNPDFKCATLTAVQGGYQEKKVYINSRVRKLTPIEYERLQTLPDNYTYGVSNTARYSICGDGWTVDIIAHIFKNI
jgi:DNA (cytosine-5)-methyltransferase 3A